MRVSRRAFAHRSSYRRSLGASVRALRGFVRGCLPVVRLGFGGCRRVGCCAFVFVSWGPAKFGLLRARQRRCCLGSFGGRLGYCRRRRHCRFLCLLHRRLPGHPSGCWLMLIFQYCLDNWLTMSAESPSSSSSPSESWSGPPSLRSTSDPDADADASE